MKNMIRDLVKKPKVNSSGYEMRYRPESPSANSKGYAPTHRVVAEKKVGGAIYSGNVVHHRDGNKLNNKPGNIQVMSKNRHDKIHGLPFKGRQKKRG